MIDTDEKVDARTVEEDMETRNNMTWLNNRVVELEAEVKRLREIEHEWLMMWATLEELNLVADVRKNMTEHGFTFPTDEDVIE